MIKKVIDIFPPNTKEEKPLVSPSFNSFEKEEVKEIPKKEYSQQPSFKERPEKEIPQKSKKSKIITLAVFVLFLAGVFGFSFFSKANIEIFPKTESMSLKAKLTIDKAQPAPDFTAKIIPGQVFEKEKTMTQSFVATGKISDETKAKGTIKVFNAYSTASQVLIANTRFVSTDGKIFRSPARVTIPGGTYSGGKLVAGEISVEVVADQPGSEYNIGPSTFSIPGFAGTDKYTKFFAQSSQAMTGGESKDVSQVTKADLENAKSVLSEKIKGESEAALKVELQSEKISSVFNYFDDAVQTEIAETFSLARAGDSLDNFNYQVKAKSGTLLFKKEDIDGFVKSFILPQIPEGKKLDEASLKVSLVPETINLSSGKITISLEISFIAYSDFDESAFKDATRGKTAAEAKMFLESQPEIAKAEIGLSPFWVAKIPQSADKINFKTSIESGQ
jgi:hypothetical protein